MAVQYRVYRNDNAGGPVDYSAPAATVPGLSWAAPALPPGSDATFAVRAFDTVSGLEDQNTDAAVRLVTAADGSDLTNRPAPARGLSARATAGGTCRAEWAVAPAPRASAPDGFRVWLAADPGPVDYAAPPTLTVPGTFAVLTGLLDGVAYLVAVRAYNAHGDDGSAATVSVVGSVLGPAEVSDLAGSLA